MSDTDSISLNGQKFDALSGRPIKVSGKTPGNSHFPKTKKPTNSHIPRGRVVDGFFNVKTINHKSIGEINNKKEHKVAPHIGRVTDKSKTLMRTAVNNPKMAKVIEQPKIVKKNLNHVVTKGVIATAPARANMSERAKAIKQSEFVSKFNDYTKPVNTVAPDPTAIQTTANSEVHLKNLDQLSQIESNPTNDSILNEAALKLSDAPTPIRYRSDHFYNRIADKFHISVKLLIVFSAILLIIIIGVAGSIILSKNISTYVAESTTGIKDIPTYVPAGYKVKTVSYAKHSSGSEITLKYQAAGTNNYTVEIQPSTWDNQALQTQVVGPTVGSNYQTIESGGRTVYIYHSTDVWVSQGNYYNLTNYANLSNSQISQIAAST